MAANDLMIYPEPTPNPASVRFVLDRPVIERGTADFPAADRAENSPLARRLFALDGVRGVLLGPNFVTVTADSSSDWSALVDLVTDVIRAHFDSGEAALIGGADELQVHADSEIEQGIVRVIEDEIRPAVAAPPPPEPAPLEKLSLAEREKIRHAYFDNFIKNLP